MSRIDDLIKQHCPNGVQHVSVTELADYIRGITYSKADEQSDGPVRVLRANNITLASNTLNFESVKRVSGAVRVRENQRLFAGDILLCAGSGSKDHIGKAAFVANDTSETFGGFMAVLRPGAGVDSRFLFHVMTGVSFRRFLGRALSTTTINNLNAGVMRGFRVPVPPIEVQREIVRVLDLFQSLEAELEAELEARRRQYAHYRDSLLTFTKSEGVKWLTLGEVCRRVSSGGTPSTSRPDFYGGTIPWVRTQEVDYSPIIATGVTITDAGLRNSSAKWIPANCIIVAMYGATAAKAAINHIPVTTNQACCNLEIDPGVVHLRYVYHWICNEYGRLRALGEGSQSNLNALKIKRYPIPVPSIAEQARIANVLDNFDALVNDLSVGLPAELAARRKQYEYYRDRLLTFHEVA